MGQSFKKKKQPELLKWFFPVRHKRKAFVGRFPSMNNILKDIPGWHLVSQGLQNNGVLSWMYTVLSLNRWTQFMRKELSEEAHNCNRRLSLYINHQESRRKKIQIGPSRCCFPLSSSVVLILCVLEQYLKWVTHTTLLHLLFASGETELNSMCSNCVLVGLLASVPSLLIMPALILCTYQSRIISVKIIPGINIFQTPVLTSKSQHLFNQVWTLNLTFFELEPGPYLFLVSWALAHFCITAS